MSIQVLFTSLVIVLAFGYYTLISLLQLSYDWTLQSHNTTSLSSMFWEYLVITSINNILFCIVVCQLKSFSLPWWLYLPLQFIFGLHHYIFYLQGPFSYRSNFVSTSVYGDFITHTYLPQLFNKWNLTIPEDGLCLCISNPN